MSSPTRAELVQYAVQAAQKVGIDPRIFVRQIDQESGFNPNAKNASGASGIAQLEPQYYPNVDTSDPYASLDAAAQTDADNLKRFNGDYAMMLAAYDAGAGAVQRAGGVPDIPETKQYVASILGTDVNNNLGGDLGERTMAQMQDSTGQDALTPEEISAIVSGGPDTGPISGDSSANAVNTTNTSYLTNDPNASVDPNGAFLTAQQMTDVLGGATGHGRIISKAQVGPATIANPQYSALNPDQPKTIPNPNPEYMYKFADNTTIFAKAVVGPDNKPVGYQITRSSNALKSPTTKATPDIREFPDKSMRQYNPATGQWDIVAPPPDATDKYPKTVRTADGTVLQYDPQSQQWSILANGKKPLEIHNFPDGSLHQYDPNTGTWTEVAPADALTQQGKALDNQDKQLQIAKAQQALMPQQQLLLDNAQKTVDAITAEWKAGRLQPSEANQLMKSVWDNLNASMQGTTLFDKQQADIKNQQAMATEGSNILRQRMSTGATLADSILSAAASHIRMPAGQTTLGIDPYAMANQEATTLGGGPQVVDWAKQMLMNAAPPSLSNGNAADGPMTQPTNTMPMTESDIIAKYPELAQPYGQLIQANQSKMPMVGGAQGPTPPPGMVPQPVMAGS